MATTDFDDDQAEEHVAYCARMTELRAMLPDLIELNQIYSTPSPPEEQQIDDGQK